MTPQEFLLVVFCLIDDQLKALNLSRLRARGSAPKLSDSEIITMPVACEFWGLDAHRALFRDFRAYHTAPPSSPPRPRSAERPSSGRPSTCGASRN